VRPRGLGRGLGALLPTAPWHDQAADPADTAETEPPPNPSAPDPVETALPSIPSALVVHGVAFEAASAAGLRQPVDVEPTDGGRSSADPIGAAPEPAESGSHDAARRGDDGRRAITAGTTPTGLTPDDAPTVDAKPTDSGAADASPYEARTDRNVKPVRVEPGPDGSAGPAGVPDVRSLAPVDMRPPLPAVSGSAGQVAAALAAALPDPSSGVVRAVDRWLWRDGEGSLPAVSDGAPAAELTAPLMAEPVAEPVDVPRGTSSSWGSPGRPNVSASFDSAGVTTPTDATTSTGTTGVTGVTGTFGDALSAADSLSTTAAEAGTGDDVEATTEAASKRDREPGVVVDSVADGAVFRAVAVDRIVANPRQPRRDFDPAALEELAASIREVGLLQPVVVRPAGDGYQLVMGERRLRASRLAGLELIPAIVRATPDDGLLRDALLENIQRVQLNPLEEAAAYGQLLDDFGCTQEQLAGRLGRSRPYVTNTLRLLKLSPPVQRRIAAGVLSAGHAKALLGHPDPAAQETLARRVVAEGLSVRTLEELVGASSGGAGSGARSARTEGRRKPIATAGDAGSVETRLSELLDTRVTVVDVRGRGRLVVEFGGQDDLSRIADLIDPAGAARTRPDVTSDG